MSEKVKRTKKDEKPQIEEVLASRDEAHSAGRELVVSRSLKVGRADDPEEGQADRMADLALRHLNSGVSASTVGVSRSLKVGRADDPEEGQADRMTELALRKISGSENANTALRKSSIDDPLGGTAVDSSVESQIQSKLGGGSTLREREASGFSNAYGVDLSGVRVHSDSVSDDLSRSLQADAFTVGSDVFFRGGLYQPGTGAGDRLLGHELAHVAIQSGHGLERMRSNTDDVVKRSVPDIPESLPADFADMSAKDRIATFQRADRERGMNKPDLISLADFSKAAEGRWPHYNENASDILKVKLKDFHNRDDFSADEMYSILTAIEMICSAYLDRRTIELAKKTGDKETGDTLIQAHKEGKVMAINMLLMQAQAGKDSLKQYLSSAGAALKIETDVGENDKKVIKMKEKYTGETASGFFKTLGTKLTQAFLNVPGSVGDDKGGYVELETDLLFGVAPGVKAGIVTILKAEREHGSGAIKAEFVLKGRLKAGISAPGFKLEAALDLGVFLEAKAPDNAQLCDWLGLGVYNNFRSILPESVVNYGWFGSNGTDFNKARSDEWMKRIEERLADPPPDEKKFTDADGKVDKVGFDDAMRRWAERAQDTYVRAGLEGGAELKAQAKLELLGNKINAVASAKGRARVGTEINQESLSKYNKKEEHDRSFSKSYFNTENEVMFELNGWRVGGKFGVMCYSSEDVRPYYEFEVKATLPWPLSSIASLLAALHQSINTYAEQGKKRIEKDMTKQYAIAGFMEAARGAKAIYDIYEPANEAAKKVFEVETAAPGTGINGKFEYKQLTSETSSGERTLWLATQYDNDIEIDAGVAEINVSGKKGQKFFEIKWR